MIEAFNSMAMHALTVLSPFLSTLPKNWCIVGSTGLALHGIQTRVEDIDIITDDAGAKKLAVFLAKFKKHEATAELPSTVSSEVQEYQIEGVTVKVLSNLKVRVNEGWVRLIELIHNRELCDFNGYWLALPSLADQLRISRLFGRDRDIKEAEQISSFLAD